MKIREGFFLILLLGSTGLMPSQASAAPQLSARVSSSELILGESVVLTVDIDWLQATENYTFVLPVPSVKNLVLKRQGESQETYQKGEALWARKTFVYEFTAEGAGAAAVESFSFNYVEPGTGASGTLQVPAFEIKVRKKGLPSIVLYAVAAFAGLLTAAILLHFKKQRHAARNAAPVSQLSMEERAAQALRQLPSVSSQEESLTKGGVVYQAYLVEKFQLPSTSFDLGQLVRRLEEKGVDAQDVKKSRQLVEKFREARYSGVPFSSSEVKEMLEEAASWIDRRKVIGAPAFSPKS